MSPEPCQCLSPHLCTCQNSRWSYPAASPPQGPFLYHSDPRFNTHEHPHHGYGHHTPVYPYPIQHYPVPLQNSTAAHVNHTQAPVSGSSRGTKRSATSSVRGAAPAKRGRRKAPPVSPTIASVCGVGPVSTPSFTVSTPSTSALNNAATSSNVQNNTTTVPTLTITTTNETAMITTSNETTTLTQEPTERYKSLRNKEPNSRTATDVWYFVRALKSAEEPAEDDKPSQEPILDIGPKSEFVGCKLCTDNWKVWKNGAGVTGTIRRHLTQYHLDIYNKVSKIANLKRSADNPNTSTSTTKEPFTIEGWISRLMKWVVVDDQSINVVDCEEFRDFALYGRENVSESDLPHRTKLIETIFKTYQSERKILLHDLQNALGRVSLTADIWSDPNLTSFMATTAHYCDKDENDRLVIQTRLLAFREIQGDHSGVHLARIFFEILKDAGLLHKIGSFTFDNASNNDTFMLEFERLLRLEKIPFDRDGNRIRCFPHVVNIACQTILKELKDNPRAPVLASSSDPLKQSHLTRYADTLAEDPVGLTRAVVSACRSSGQRRADLKKLIVVGNASDLWTEPVPVLQLLRDCDTRWSSTYLMMNRMTTLYPAITHFLVNKDGPGLEHILLGNDELQVLYDISAILERPHATQELLSAEKTPTLPMALPAYELLLDAWRKLQPVIPELSYYIGVGIEKIEEYVAKGRKSRVYALAMILNPSSKFEWIEKHWSREEAKQAEVFLEEAMLAFCQARRRGNAARVSQDLSSTSRAARNPIQAQAKGFARLQSLGVPVRRTVSLHSISTPSPSPSPSPAPSPLPINTPPELTDVEKAAKAAAATAEAVRKEAEELAYDLHIVRNEIAKYRNRGLLPLSELNMVKYWDEAETVFPLMYKVALDILPAQASAVPCERVFSSSKETCTVRRNRLSPALLEVLQILKFLFKQERLDFSEDWVAKEEDYTIEGEVTEHAIRELLSSGPGKVTELLDLLNNMDSLDSEGTT